MKNKVIVALILGLVLSNSAFAEYSFVDSSDFTGDAFFTPPALQEQKNLENDENSSVGHSSKSTVPPIKKLRLYMQAKKQERIDKKNQLAPTDPNASIYNSDKETSEYVSKEVEEVFDENMMPDGFEADEESIVENKKAKHFWTKKKEAIPEPEHTENIILDCENMDYDTDSYCLYANGNVNVEFVKQQTIE